MRKTLLILTLLGASGLFGQVSFGIQIGAPPPPRVVHALPHSPGAGYVWVDGYWFADGRRWKWHNGYWTRPPFGGARWVNPRYEGGQFFAGYWDGDRGRFDHDHKWDRDHNRDYRDHR